MREFAFQLSEALRNGLRRDSRSPSNVPAMTEMFNAKPMEYGAVAIDRVTEAIPDFVTLSLSEEAPIFYAPINASLGVSDAVVTQFPYPQIFKGRNITLLADIDRTKYAKALSSL